MNFSESRYMAEELISRGLLWTDDLNEADLIIVNACSVRKHAEDRAVGWISSVSGKRAKIIAVGCLASHVPERLISAGADEVSAKIDFEKIDRIESGKVLFSDNQKSDRIEYEIPVVVGCDRFCTYCIVPYLRGKVVSKDPEEIFSDVEKCASKGGEVFSLLGQNVNRYDYKGYRFSSLLNDVSYIAGVKKVTFMTSHPADLSKETVETVAGNGKILKHFHLPFQTGSDKLLKQMKRGYDVKKYTDDISMIRDIYPEMRLTTDVMVGLPGESKSDFQDTIDLVRRIRFDEAYMYAFSPRKGTLDNLMPGQAEEDVGKKRLAELIVLQNGISLEKKKEKLNTKQRAMITSISRFGGYSLGILADFSPVLIDAEFERGRELDVMLSGLKGATLFGQPV